MDSPRTENGVGFLRRIGRSVFRGPWPPRDDRQRAWFTFHTLLLHFRPTRLPAATLRYTHTFGLGGMSLVLVVMLMITGLLMMFVYEPSPERAYASVQSLQEDVAFGRFVRATHHWSANFLILVALLHLLRVFYTAGFRGKRQFNWIVGLSLFACILASNFTGYLLPWDQLSYWAVTICTGMLAYVPGIGSWLQQVVRGGPEIGSSTLIIFYALHTSVVPVLLIVLMAWHFWRVRKAGGVVAPPTPTPASPAEKVLFLPNLFLREVAVGLSLVALVFLVALLFAAPLGAPGNPGMSPNPAKAPWYFLGVQELLLHLHPVVAIVVFPGLATLALLLLPYLDADSDLSGRWFLSGNGRRMACLASLTALAWTSLWVVLDERFGANGTGTLPAAISRGLLPLLLLLAAVTGFYGILKRLFGASRDETVQAVFTLLFVGLVVLTCTGIWFRGAEMQLVWPWER